MPIELDRIRLPFTEADLARLEKFSPLKSGVEQIQTDATEDTAIESQPSVTETA